MLIKNIVKNKNGIPIPLSIGSQFDVFSVSDTENYVRSLKGPVKSVKDDTLENNFNLDAKSVFVIHLDRDRTELRLETLNGVLLERMQYSSIHGLPSVQMLNEDFGFDPIIDENYKYPTVKTVLFRYKIDKKGLMESIERASYMAVGKDMQTIREQQHHEFCDFGTSYSFDYNNIGLLTRMSPESLGFEVSYDSRFSESRVCWKRTMGYQDVRNKYIYEDVYEGWKPIKSIDLKKHSGVIQSYSVCEYNEQGDAEYEFHYWRAQDENAPIYFDIEELLTLDSYLNGKRVYEYEYDTFGNWIKRSLSIRDKIIHENVREIRYHEDGEISHIDDGSPF